MRPLKKLSSSSLSPYLRFIIAWALRHIFHQFFLLLCHTPIPNPRGSMRPTLNPNPGTDKSDKCLIYKWNYKPQRGDVVCVRSPTKPGGSVIKRVIGLEGDFIKVRSSAPLKIVQVPAGQVWLEGDNTAWSYDSNSYGPIPVNLIEGKALYVTWPQEWPSWGTSRFLANLDTQDKSHRRATDKEFVEWLKRKQEYKQYKMMRWCEARRQEDIIEKNRATEARLASQQKDLENYCRKWEQFVDELEIEFFPIPRQTPEYLTLDCIKEAAD